MLRYHKVAKQSTLEVVRQAKRRPRPRRLSLLTALMVIFLFSVACALIGPSQSATRHRVIRSHLPTLTPTALPTSIPIAAQAVTLSTEPISAIPTPVPVVIPTFTPAPTPVISQPTLNPAVVLNARSGPNIDYPIMGKLTPGQSYQVVGKNPEGTWWQIIYPPNSGNLAWVSADAQYSTASSAEAVQIAQLPPPPPPTATPTPSPTTIPPTLTPTQSVVTPPPAPGETPNPFPVNTPASESPGWVFASVRLYPDYQGGLLLYGNVTNNTGTLQKLESISGAFFDPKGKEVSDKDEIYGYWPVDEVPPGSTVPFELVVGDVDEVADFKLSTEAEPGGHNPRQDFKFTDVKQWAENDTFCIKGKIHIPDDLEDYLVIAVILYDEQDNMIKFGDYGVFSSGAEINDGKSDFEICVDPPNQGTVRYDLQAWGS